MNDSFVSRTAVPDAELLADAAVPSVAAAGLQTLPQEDFIRADVDFCALRLDRIHPLLSGNKWYKLKYNLQQAGEQGKSTILSFGGAYSNHIHALAAAGKLYGFSTIGVIRGELRQPLNPTLRFAVEQGMHLQAVSRSDYRRRAEPDYIEALRQQFGDFHLVPEGGSNALGVRGCTEIAHQLRQALAVRPGKKHSMEQTFVALACGTGATMAGLIAGLQGNGRILGFPVLKGGGFLEGEIQRQLQVCGYADPANWRLETAFHFGGYGRVTPELLAFVEEMEQEAAIPLEPIYTGKMFFGLRELVRQGAFPCGSRVIAIHSGGLQGWQRGQ